MDYALGEVYSGVFTVRPFLLPAMLSLIHVARRTRTRSGQSCTRQARRSTTACGVCRLTRSTARRFTAQTRTCATCVSSSSRGGSLADRKRQTGGKRAGCCTAALFLKSFVEGVEPAETGEEPPVRWAHLDIAGSMEVCSPGVFLTAILVLTSVQASGSGPYHEVGMTGRPTRALIEWVRGMVEQQ